MSSIYKARKLNNTKSLEQEVQVAEDKVKVLEGRIEEIQDKIKEFEDLFGK
jgi:phage shock protein A